eukprot:TRINITY_DN60745_c0_g1_i1.p1 TRINITY_DN60745_c0_g1~~TRINITY_DN60745_c0_g1_i1.p1  ORF type:complete len:323 (+),score=70.94 TRINITY_DN60745_c0_g1_i1:77-970(+)
MTPALPRFLMEVTRQGWIPRALGGSPAACRMTLLYAGLPADRADDAKWYRSMKACVGAPVWHPERRLPGKLLQEIGGGQWRVSFDGCIPENINLDECELGARSVDLTSNRLNTAQAQMELEWLWPSPVRQAVVVVFNDRLEALRRFGVEQHDRQLRVVDCFRHAYRNCALAAAAAEQKQGEKGAAEDGGAEATETATTETEGASTQEDGMQLVSAGEVLIDEGKRHPLRATLCVRAADVQRYGAPPLIPEWIENLYVRKEWFQYTYYILQGSLLLWVVKTHWGTSWTNFPGMSPHLT